MIVVSEKNGSANVPMQYSLSLLSVREIQSKYTASYHIIMKKRPNHKHNRDEQINQKLQAVS